MANSIYETKILQILMHHFDILFKKDSYPISYEHLIPRDCYRYNCFYNSGLYHAYIVSKTGPQNVITLTYFNKLFGISITNDVCGQIRRRLLPTKLDNEKLYSSEKFMMGPIYQLCKLNNERLDNDIDEIFVKYHLFKFAIHDILVSPLVIFIINLLSSLILLPGHFLRLKY